MTHVAVVCPDCRRGFVVNGRGRCRCGSYLIHHIGRGKSKLIDPDDPRPTWDMRSDPPKQIHPWGWPDLVLVRGITR